MTLSEKIFDTLWRSNIKRYPSIDRTEKGDIEFAVFFERPDLEFIFYFRVNDFEAGQILDKFPGAVISPIESGLNEFWKEIAEHRSDWTLDLILNGDLYPGK